MTCAKSLRSIVRFIAGASFYLLQYKLYRRFIAFGDDVNCNFPANDLQTTKLFGR
jgi:hypothetical protein